MTVSNTTVDHISLPVLLVTHLEDWLPGTFVTVHITLIEEEVLKKLSCSELDTGAVDSLEYLLRILTILHLDRNEANIVDDAI